MANCSGGTTPWNTVLSCEENFQDYGEDEYGWGDPYEISRSARYGWVVEHDPYDPGSTPRKHTALGRFRHENAALRHVRGKKLVVYMGDDAKNEGVYKFVSDRRAVFMLPARGPNRGVAFRFANMPVEAEGTGPYFSPDGSTLFINVQHPGEETPSREGARYGDPATYSSWWPGGNRTAQTGRRGKPKPSTVAVTRVRD